jgi:hypothetical protein
MRTAPHETTGGLRGLVGEMRRSAAAWSLAQRLEAVMRRQGEHPRGEARERVLIASGLLVAGLVPEPAGWALLLRVVGREAAGEPPPGLPQLDGDARLTEQHRLAGLLRRSGAAALADALAADDGTILEAASRATALATRLEDDEFLLRYLLTVGTGLCPEFPASDT